MGTDIELSVVPPEEKRSICVSSPVADLMDCIPEEPVTRLRRICVEFSALSSRRLPSSLKTAEAQAATSQSSSLLSLHLTTTVFHDSSPHLLSLIVRISQSNLCPTSAPPLLLSSLRSNNRTQRKHQDILGDKAVTYSDGIWCLSVQEVSAKTDSARHTADLLSQRRPSGIFCWIACF